MRHHRVLRPRPQGGRRRVDRDRAPHGRHAPPPGPRRPGGLGRRGGRPRPRLPPAGDRRPHGRGAPADGLGVGALSPGLQRRGLQSRRPASRAGGVRGRPVPRAFRHRGHAGRVRALGAGPGPRAVRGHVRVRPLGPPRTDPAAGPRPDRREAALLRMGGGRARLRLRAQGAAGLPRLRGRGRPRGAGPLHEVGLRPGPPFDLPGHPQAPARHEPDDRRRTDRRRRRPPRSGALLVGPPRRRGRGRRALRGDRGGGGRPTRGAAPRGGGPPDGGRRPPGGLPLGRGRLLDDRGPDAGPEPAAGEDVHHRLRGGRLRRGEVRQGGGTPPGDRAHRALRHPRRGAGGDPVVAGPLRRALRRLVGHPDLPRLADGPASRSR